VKEVTVLIDCQWELEMEELQMLVKGKTIHMKLQKQTIYQMVMTLGT
jgi:hypothetical protein